MPIYEYQCPSCGTRFELLVQLRQEATTAVCPDCGANASKVISRFAISSPGGQSSQIDESPAPQNPNITPKEDIERWRKESKRKW